jgi:hypothetical protein
VRAALKSYESYFILSLPSNLDSCYFIFYICLAGSKKHHRTNFTARDEMVKFHGVIVSSPAIKVINKFKNFYEDWEFHAITIKKSAHERLLI